VHEKLNPKGAMKFLDVLWHSSKKCNWCKAYKTPILGNTKKSNQCTMSVSCKTPAINLMKNNLYYQHSYCRLFASTNCQFSQLHG